VEERRGAIRRQALRRVAAVVAAALHAAAFFIAVAGFVDRAAADACEPPAGFTPRARVEASGVAVIFRTVPDPIEIGRHFRLEAVVCAGGGRDGATGDTAPVLTRVDADMPEHRHGMNYRPTLSATERGRYVAEGFMFHMPGRWQLVFDVEHAGRRTRLTTDVVLD
jgi:hypothetical protein